MKVLSILPGKKPEAIDLDGSLKSMQDFVGGLIQALYPFADPVALVCNDEGKLLGMEYNRALRDSQSGALYDLIAGPFFICGIREGEFTALSEELVEKYMALYAVPEQFIQIGGQLLILPMEEQVDW